MAKYQLAGKPGQLSMIRARDMRVPHEYQRMLNKGFAARIARDFDWFRFGVLTVAHRRGPDGSKEFYLVDGQTRHAAVMMIDPDLLVPCMLYDFDNPEHEAQIFVAQRARRSINDKDVHRAELFMGGPEGEVARLAQGFVDGLGCKYFEAMTTVRALFRAKREAFERIASLLQALSRDGALSKDMIEAFVTLEDELAIEDKSLAADYRARLISMGYDAIKLTTDGELEGMRAAANLRNRPTSKVAKAEALRRALGMRDDDQLAAAD